MKVHFIAIGGSVMHQLALALHKNGYTVNGSDDEIFEPALSNLQKEGILPASMGWFPEKITYDLDAVILGMQAKQDNPELQHAMDLGLKIYSFPEYIYEESRHKTRVVAGGNHGKTTTTAMIMHVLRKTGHHFDYLAGARPEGFDLSVRVTHAPVVVCEGDESPASVIDKRPIFHFLFPHIAILTDMDRDYREQFSIFIKKIEPGGILIYNETDQELNKLVNINKRTDIRYQPYQLPQHTIEDGSTTLTLEGQTVEWQVPGNSNLLNMHAAWYACRELGINATDFVHAISSFTGISKGPELPAQNGGTIVYRD